MAPRCMQRLRVDRTGHGLAIDSYYVRNLDAVNHMGLYNKGGERKGL